MFLVDTTVWIDFFKGRDTFAVQRLSSLIESEEDVFTSGTIVQEVLSGIKEKRDRKLVLENFREFILIMPSLDTHIMAAEIYDSCRKKGYTIRSAVDCLIASLAIEYDLCLLHNDRDYHYIAKVFPLNLDMPLD